MKKQALVSMFSAMILVTACGKTKSSESTQAASADSATEHCVKAESCFLEVESKGSSVFYAAESNYSALLTDPVVSQMNISVEKIADEKYKSLISEKLAPKIAYSLENPAEIHVYQNSNARAGAVRSFTKIFGNFVNALSGIASTFSIANVLHQWFGTEGNVKAQVSYHFGSTVETEQVQIDRK
jgi:hypothetical protein